MHDENHFIDVGDSFSDMVAKKSPDQISVEVSLMTTSEHLSFVSEILNRLEINLEGEGMEIAAGVSILCCSLARLYPNIKKIHALEIVPGMVTKLQPKIIEHTNMQNRVIPLIGDFDNIKFPDQSLDFIAEFDSLHHSNNLKKTLLEVARVLKPGGKLVCFDRAQPNHMTKNQENFLLNTEYSTAYKTQRGLNSNEPYKRSDNGEHEPRIKDWELALQGTGLKIDTIAIFSRRTFKGFIKILVAHIPYLIRAKLKKWRNLTAHNKLILYFLFPSLSRYGKLRIFPLNTKLKSPTAPMAKMVIIISKTNLL